jgi:class 3 adenylate cyclase
MSRGPVSLRRRLTVILVGVAAASVLLLTGVNTVVTQALLDDTVQDNLVSVRTDRTAAIERGIEAVRASTSSLGADPGLVAAFADFAAAWDEFSTDVTPAQQRALEAIAREEVVAPAGDTAVPPAASLVPRTLAGRQAQWLTVAQNPFDPDERAAFDDPGGDSPWATTHADHHPFLRNLMATTVASDLLMVTADTGEIVYSVSKHLDIGTNAITGPYADPALGALRDALQRVTLGSTVVLDSTPYLPHGSAPTMFAAVGVRAGSEAIGALVLTIPIERLTDLVTGNQDLEVIGLGDTGQVGVIGADGTWRTEPRQWTEDPDAYLEQLEQLGEDGAATAEEIRRTGSPVLVESVANPAIEAAQRGEQFLGTVRNGLGATVLAATEPVVAGSLGWVVLVEQARSESTVELAAFLRHIGLLLVILLSAITLVGGVAARAMTRPIRPVVDASDALAGGAIDIELPELGRNEVGDLGQQLVGVAAELRRRRAEIGAEERRIEAVLSGIVPARLMERVRAGERSFPDMFETATVVSVSLVGVPDDPSDADQDTILEFTTRITSELDQLAEEHGVEVGKVAANHELFVAGQGRPHAGQEAAARFAVAVAPRVAAVAREFGLDITARVGAAAGTIGTGLVGTSQVSFGIWGDPPALAAILEGLAAPGTVLVDASVADALGPDWEIQRVGHPGGLDEDAPDAFLLEAPGHVATPGEDDTRGVDTTRGGDDAVADARG